MKGTTVFILLIFSLIFLRPSFADEFRDQLLRDIDEIEAGFQKEDAKLIERIEKIENRLTNFSIKIGEIHSIDESVKGKYNEILEIKAGLNELKRVIIDNGKALSSIKTQISSIQADQARIEGNVNSSQNIVTWVTLIVSVLVILIGLFFSKLFLDLYSNYKVLASHIPEPMGKQTIEAEGGGGNPTI